MWTFLDTVWHMFVLSPLQTIYPSRVLPGATGQLWEVTQQFVHKDVREAVYAELGGVSGPVHWAKALLHWRQRQLGGDVEWLLVQAAGTYVSVTQLPVPLHRWLPGVHWENRWCAKAFWRCAQETENSGHQGFHCCTDVCPRANGGSGGCQQGC